MTTDLLDAPTFADLGLQPEILTTLTTMGFVSPTPIQAEAIPVIAEGSDLLGQAATGTGKTAAFGLPLLQRLGAAREIGSAPMALVLVPTRELAIQVSDALAQYGAGIGARVVAVYGGQPIGRQIGALERGVDIVVATPGRALDLVKRRSLRLDEIEAVVLDEADEMLDMGFAEEIDGILAAAPAERQSILFSATMPPRLDSIVRRHLKDPVRISIAREVVRDGEAPRVRQCAYFVSRHHKAAAIGRLLDVEPSAAAIVFCRTRDQVDRMTEELNERGYRAEALHGGMDQHQRDRVMGRLRSGTAQLLVATDVAARGIDVDRLTHVVNADVPTSPETYVHRIGRVGRAGREGVAVTLAEPREQRMIKTIERVTGHRIPAEKLPTVADVRARRLAALAESLEERLASGDGLTAFEDVVGRLVADHDAYKVALAAVALAHEATASAHDEVEVPEMELRPLRERDQSGPRAPRGDGDRGRRPLGPSVRVFIGAGRSVGMRPQDLVGAIANETSVRGNQVGAIKIGDRFSLVEVPKGSADEVIQALRRSTVKGRKVTVRRERFEREER